jgi:glucose-6-phosphate isomerase
MGIMQKIYSNQPLDQKNIDKVVNARFELFNDAEKESLLLSQETDDTIQKIKNVANRVKGEFSTLVIIGAGASINIPKMLWSFSSTELKVFFVERVDERELHNIFNQISAQDTCVLSISKSGNTPEVNFLLVKFIQWFKKHLSDSELKTHLYFITEIDSILDKFARSLGATSIPHPVNVGGRFSFFNTTGLLPAAIFGFGVEKFIVAGKGAFRELIKEDSWAIEGAIYNYSMSQKLLSQSVLIKYDSVFDGALSWLRQLISESLGKNNKGFTPIVSDGLIDRHSQLQLFLDGPEDKFFTLFSYDNKAVVSGSEDAHDHFVDLLISRKIASQSFKAFNQKQELALLNTMLHSQKNIRHFIFDSIDESSIASFVMGNMLEIMLYAYIVDIDPFGQPAIEKFKQALNSVE